MKSVISFCENYFAVGLTLLAEKKLPQKIDGRIGLTLFSYITLVAPLIIAALYGAASLYGRVHETTQPSSQNTRVNEVVEQIFNPPTPLEPLFINEVFHNTEVIANTANCDLEGDSESQKLVTFRVYDQYREGESLKGNLVLEKTISREWVTTSIYFSRLMSFSTSIRQQKNNLLEIAEPFLAESAMLLEASMDGKLIYPEQISAAIEIARYIKSSLFSKWLEQVPQLAHYWVPLYQIPESLSENHALILTAAQAKSEGFTTIADSLLNKMKPIEGWEVSFTDKGIKFSLFPIENPQASLDSIKELLTCIDLLDPLVLPIAFELSITEDTADENALSLLKKLADLKLVKLESLTLEGYKKKSKKGGWKLCDRSNKQELFNAIADFKYLKSLNIKGNNLGKDAPLFCETIATALTQLEWLDISENELGKCIAQAAKSIRIIATTLPNLERLDLSSNSIGSDSYYYVFEDHSEKWDENTLSTFSKTVALLKKLKVLSLSHNPIGKAAPNVIKIIAERIPELEWLEIRNCSIRDGRAVVQIIGSYLLKLKGLDISCNTAPWDSFGVGPIGGFFKLIGRLPLKVLKVSANWKEPFDPIDLEDLNQAQQLLSNLEVLDFSSNAIEESYDGTESIFSIFKFLSNLKFFNLSHSSIGFKTGNVEKLSANIKFLSKLEFFDLTNNSIGTHPGDAELIGASIGKWLPNLEFLDLNYNPIGQQPQGASLFASGISPLKKLKGLALTRAKIGKEVNNIDNFFRALAHQSNLEFLILRQNEIGIGGSIQFFSQVIPSLIGLKRLDLTLNYIGINDFEKKDEIEKQKELENTRNFIQITVDLPQFKALAIHPHNVGDNFFETINLPEHVKLSHHETERKESEVQRYLSFPKIPPSGDI